MVIRILKHDGWCHVPKRGSRWDFKHYLKWWKVAVSRLKKHIYPSTLQSIGKNRGKVKLMKYLAVLNKNAVSNSSFHFPDFLGCITTGKTVEEAREFAKEALELHIESMQEDGDPIPAPSSFDEIIKDPDNRGLMVFEVDAQEKDPAVRVNVTLPRSVLSAIGDKCNRSAFLTEAAREKLHMHV